MPWWRGKRSRRVSTRPRWVRRHTHCDTSALGRSRPAIPNWCTPPVRISPSDSSNGRGTARRMEPLPTPCGSPASAVYRGPRRVQGYRLRSPGCYGGFVRADRGHRSGHDPGLVLRPDSAGTFAPATAGVRDGCAGGRSASSRPRRVDRSYAYAPHYGAGAVGAERVSAAGRTRSRRRTPRLPGR